MLTAIILKVLAGWVRHAISGVGGALLASGIQLVDNIPAVHNLTHAIAGVALLAASGGLSALQKVKTKSGADYKNLNS